MADATVRGYAVLWNELSENLGGFRERFRRGAFSESLADDDTKFMVRSHDLGRPVASTSSGTLELAEDGVGLRFKARLPGSGDAGDLAAMVKRRVLSKVSFAFSTEHASDETFTEENGQLIRTIKRARLFEVSPVTFPAYPQTSIRDSEISEKQEAAERMKKAQQEREQKTAKRTQTDRRRKRTRLAQAAINAAQRPPPEPLSAIRSRVRRKARALASK